MRSMDLKHRTPAARIMAAIIAGAILSGNSIFAAAPVPSPIEQLAKHDVEKQAQQDVKKSATVGAVVGGALGGLLGRKAGLRKEEGIVLGAAVGGLTGAAIGKIAADRRRQYASESAFLDAEIKTANTAIETKEKQIAKLEADLEADRRQVAALEERRRANATVSVEAKTKLEELNRDVAAQKELETRYKDTLEYIKQSLATSPDPANTEEAEKLKAQREQLAAQRASLEAQYARLQKVSEGTTALVQAVEPMARAL